MCSVWVEEKAAWQQAREQFRRATRGGREGPIAYVYPEDLAGNFLSFGSWLNRHIRMLRSDGYPVSSELIELHCPPSDVALSYKAMWAYGSHFRCTSEVGDSSVSFDSGIASIGITSSPLDVGILKDILLISYGKLNCVLMQGDWIKPTEQGRAAIRKDRLGFWSVLYNARDRGSQVNPFVFPCNVSQVFFMDDGVSENWKTVLRHEPRSRRMTEDTEFPDFESAGDDYPLPNGAAAAGEAVVDIQAEGVIEDEIVDAGRVRLVDAEAETVDEETYLDDNDYEEEVVFAYVE